MLRYQSNWYGVIYAIKNRVNGKAYVGQTIVRPPSNRWSVHQYFASKGDPRPLYRAMRKYGVASFSFELVEYCLNQKELDQAEIKHADLLHALVPTGYSLRVGEANGRHAAITKRKIKKAHSTPEVREYKRTYMIVVHQDPEFKKRHSKSIKEALKPPEKRLMLSKNASEVQARPETKKRWVQLRADPDFCKKHQQATIDAMQRPEIKALSISNGFAVQARPEVQALLQSFDYKKKHRDATKAGLASDEVRYRIGTGTRATRYITNGKETLRLKAGKPLPTGWRYGRGTFEQGNWITNGVERKIIRKDEPIPVGWELGMTASSVIQAHKEAKLQNKKKSLMIQGLKTRETRWVTNELVNRRIHRDLPLPKGWRLGRMSWSEMRGYL